MTSQAAPGTEFFINEGEASLTTGNFQRARKFFSYVFQRDRDNVAALVGLGKTWLALENLERSLEFFQEAARVSPEDPRLMLDTAILLLNCKRYEEALVHLDLARKKGGDTVDHRYWLAMVHSARKEYRASGRAFREALNLDPNHYPSLLEWGIQLLFETNQLDSAKFLLRKAARLVAGEADPWIYLGICYFKLSDHRKSQVILKKALRLNPMAEMALYYFCQNCLKLNLPARALRPSRRLLRLSPEADEFRLVHLDLLVALGHHVQIIEFCLNLLTKEREYLPAYEYLTLAYAARGETDLASKARASMDRVLERTLVELSAPAH